MNQFKSYKENPMYLYLVMLVMASAFGFQGWQTLFNNFAVDTIGLNSIQVGAIQSVKEIPGFLTFFAVFILLIIAEHRFAALAVLLLGLGDMMAGLFPSFGGLLVTTLILSTGYHYFETCNQSLTLQYFAGERVPIVLARLKSYTALSNVTVGIFIWVISDYLSIQTIFFIIGSVVILIGLYSYTRKPVDKALPVQHKKLILRKKYWLFYVLNLLSGARRQIFMVFSVFLLVQKYHFSVAYISTLFVVNNIITYFLSPVVGRAINRYGERTMLTVEYTGLFLVFMGYALVENQYFATGMYLADNLFFSFVIAINSFFRKQADPKDIAPSMSVGFTINHLTAVILPVVGGFLWTINWRIPFFASAVLALISLLFAQMVKTPRVQQHK
ncbi:putative permease of the major facilitator superfamily [Desulforapulum autotrophicum HRM2]|uniref:Permease of the major facilitator superfamily n=1 Tax=Desulforapulum autotrophicum (strain ATCC 43914 / DSM 3382 / VKM B-1955 / HRM2) TaxID=177437 RepID=C0QMB5_DESAH|nr:MFS transporter [Desulforapulum autotrophicum]ACN16432.1 putative permease of the major facilitator superfamily [Desulforapulum autotrophicum HRM2]